MECGGKRGGDARRLIGRSRESQIRVARGGRCGRLRANSDAFVSFPCARDAENSGCAKDDGVGWSLRDERGWNRRHDQDESQRMIRTKEES